MEKIIIAAFALLSFNLSYSQNNNQQGFLDDFKASASITNNGISLVPTFSLGDPAILFDVKLIKGKYSFEPDIRYSLEGKPWTMLFWFRHKTVEKKNFSLRTGIHPGVNFRTIQINRDVVNENIIEANETSNVSISVIIFLSFLYKTKNLKKSTKFIFFCLV